MGGREVGVFRDLIFASKVVTHIAKQHALAMHSACDECLRSTPLTPFNKLKLHLMFVALRYVVIIDNNYIYGGIT